MSKPFNKFGGWLGFCEFTIVTSFLLIMIDIVPDFIALVWVLFKHISKINNQDIVSLVIGFFLSLILVFIQINIFKILKITISTIPTQISKLFIIWLIVIIINITGVFLASHFNIVPESFNDKAKTNIFVGLIIPLSWLAYFRWSKRVKAYYGANAFE